MRKVFITGEDGMLGRELERQLNLDSNYCFINSVNNNPYKLDKQIQASYAWTPELDVTNKDLVIESFKEYKPDIVIHFAAIVNTDRCLLNLDRAYKVNVEGSYNVALACNNIGAKLVYVSTTAAYDPKGPRPHKEEDVQKPHTFYGATKMAGEHLSRTLCKDNLLIIRPCFIYGSSRDTSSNIAKVLLAMKNNTSVELNIDERFSKDYTFIEDFGSAIKLLLDIDSIGIFNITAGNPLVYTEIMDIVRDVVKYNVKIHYKRETEYMFDHIVSNRKMLELGWVPRYGFREGVAVQAKLLIS